MRGEHPKSQSSCTSVCGSSPHARGTRNEFPLSFHRRRFIPACAGNTKKYSRPTAALIGSSPHARGTLRLSGVPVDALRFIPACAGNTPSSEVVVTGVSVHPRMRGEHNSDTKERGTVTGSSPHARGTLHQVLVERHRDRFIPACAGNTRAVLRRSVGLAVHPRMRGEHGLQQLRRRRIGGSSPHARGTRCATPARQRRWRFIPACAGNTRGP